MPELPEVETTRRGIEPHLKAQTIAAVKIRQAKLRWPIPAALVKKLPQQTIHTITRRGKYLLIQTAIGTLIIHLGMSGSLRILTDNKTPPTKHDHFDIVLSNQACLRFNDPRRFGCILWTEADPLLHKLLKNLGPEPLTPKFNADYLYQYSRQRKVSIKLFIMNAAIVVGVGNIYANEALFLAGIAPERIAATLTVKQCELLITKIKFILAKAIKQGGTTLKNFSNSDGKPGYFKQHLNVYGRGGLPCIKCKTTLQEIRLGQRSTVFCSKCQK
jgi:formamidopyrimidine-DNA glycosylase